MTTPYTLAPTELTPLSPRQSIALFRDLLWCQARRRGVPLTKIHITTAENVPDGGVDAEVDDGVIGGQDDVLVAGRSFYQLKAGGSASPWQKSWTHAELFGTGRQARLEDLGVAVRRCLACGGRYVLVCFGIDPTPQQLQQARCHLADAFSACGFPRIAVEVWAQTHLVGLISQYPSLSLRLLGPDRLEFQSVAEWRADAGMSARLELGGRQQEFLEQVRQGLRGHAVRHLRVIGEPGLGKTRLVLEAVSAEDIAGAVVYVPHAEDFQMSQLHRELLRPDSELTAVIVLDECRPKDMASIWSALKNRSDRVRLVSIDHGPEDSADELMRVLQCPPLENEQVAAIVRQYVDSKFDADRWARICDGSPRVAHAVGQNLRSNPEDVLKPPATVQLWDRFVAGYERTESPAAAQRLIVLRHAALFEKFGFDAPVEAEARFVCELAQTVDPQLTWPQFQSIVYDLKRRRILQGKTTLFIVPRALHVHLWIQFWQHHGRGVDLKALLPRVPESLLGWFTGMFPYAHASEVATRQVEHMLGTNGPFDDEFVESRLGAAFLNELAEASPRATLACLERTVGTWDESRLSSFREARQEIVWALEKIAVWPELFRRAALVLLHLASCENGSNSNNASGTFAGLFSLADGPLAPTGAHPSDRLPVLKIALESPYPQKRALGLKAGACALSMYHGGKIVGPEHQGLRPTANMWTPKTYGEWYDAYRAVWDTLVRARTGWMEEEQSAATKVLIDAALGLVQNRFLADMVLDTLEGLADDPTIDLRELVRFTARCSRILRKNISRTRRARIERLDRKITGRSLESNIRRYVLLSNWDDDYDDGGKRSDRRAQRIRQLARQAVKSPRRLRPLLPALVSQDGGGLGSFGSALGELDVKRRLLPAILDAYRAAPTDTNPWLLASYLHAVFVRNESEWESLVLALLVEDVFKGISARLVPSSGLTDGVLRWLLNESNRGTVSVDAFKSLAYVRDPGKVDGALWDRLIEKLLALDEGAAGAAAIEIADRIYSKHEEPVSLPEEPVYVLLTSPHTFSAAHNSMSDHHWQALAERFARQYPNRGPDLLRHMLRRCQDWEFELALVHHPVGQFLLDLVRRRPMDCWSVVTDVLKENEGVRRGTLRLWLGPRGSFGERRGGGPMELFPADLVLSWVNEDPAERALLVARCVRKTVDPEEGGRLARELLVRFGHVQHLNDVLAGHFWSDGYCGKASEHYRKKRDEVYKWLSKERDPTVVRWLERYASGLTHDIERAEIEEERRY